MNQEEASTESLNAGMLKRMMLPALVSMAVSLGTNIVTVRVQEQRINDLYSRVDDVKQMTEANSDDIKILLERSAQSNAKLDVMLDDRKKG